ncbi:MAG: PEP/pyruvate-binding domain-containing protein [Bacteroidetes bacterium]|nr:PEP/pyruvate-binding domain-containing protein [Bacteroidota bacterium]
MKTEINSPDIRIIGDGEPGGKASGLIRIQKIISEKIDKNRYPKLDIGIPKFLILSTSVFDRFMERNGLSEKAYAMESDLGIAHMFQKAVLPVEVLGDLRNLVNEIKNPIAVRSSSMLEDSLEEPFAGVYGTKMIANNSPFTDERYKILTEAIKFVYSSMFFKSTKQYFTAIKRNIREEKMAVVLQEVAGSKHYNRFYPEISGVARSYNYYPSGRSTPEQGVAQLALGLGKTIVDDGISWNYTPAFPDVSPPFSGVNEMLKKTQTKFWAVNTGPVYIYDPVKETEFMSEVSLEDADYDNTISYSASTFDAQSNRVRIGVGYKGVRVINFAPLLQIDEFGFNGFLRDVLKICEKEMLCPVEIEFALSHDKETGMMKFHFLQMRPMFVSSEIVSIKDDELKSGGNLLVSEKVLGNGFVDGITDIVYVKKETFDAGKTPFIALELEEINKKLQEQNRKAVFIGFGRWGSTDKWLGIPVDWGQISSAKAIVEVMLPDFNIELSQGSHFFHNLISFKVSYFSVDETNHHVLDWDWLERQKSVEELIYVKHIKADKPLKIYIDGRKGRGIIKK